MWCPGPPIPHPRERKGHTSTTCSHFHHLRSTSPSAPRASSSCLPHAPSRRPRLSSASAASAAPGPSPQLIPFLPPPHPPPRGVLLELRPCSPPLPGAAQGSQGAVPSEGCRHGGPRGPLQGPHWCWQALWCARPVQGWSQAGPGDKRFGESPACAGDSRLGASQRRGHHHGVSEKRPMPPAAEAGEQCGKTARCAVMDQPQLRPAPAQPEGATQRLRSGGGGARTARTSGLLGKQGEGPGARHRVTGPESRGGRHQALWPELRGHPGGATHSCSAQIQHLRRRGTGHHFCDFRAVGGPAGWAERWGRGSTWDIFSAARGLYYVAWAGRSVRLGEVQGTQNVKHPGREGRPLRPSQRGRASTSPRRPPRPPRGAARLGPHAASSPTASLQFTTHAPWAAGLRAQVLPAASSRT